MSASALLRASRLSARFSQVELAERAATSQPDVSAIESGKRVPTVDTLERLLQRTGHRLIAVPGLGPDAVETAERIAAAVRAGNRDGALRAFIDYSDRLAHAGRAERIILSYVEPGPTASHAWDAALAAVSDYWLNKSNLPRSDWMMDPARTLASPEAPHLGDLDLAADRDEVPNEFLRRNVLIERTTLASV
jgi:transcriptional regulator with XRE-family HTH domain